MYSIYRPQAELKAAPRMAKPQNVVEDDFKLAQLVNRIVTAQYAVSLKVSDSDRGIEIYTSASYIHPLILRVMVVFFPFFLSRVCVPLHPHPRLYFPVHPLAVGFGACKVTRNNRIYMISSRRFGRRMTIHASIRSVDGRMRNHARSTLSLPPSWMVYSNGHIPSRY